MYARISRIWCILVIIAYTFASLSGARNNWAPDFLIIGAQKCGTTALYQYMIKHPLIKAAEKKELHFFDIYFYKGASWYKQQFPKRFGKQYCIGEATPYYLFHPQVPKRVYALYPKVKLIVLLRDPVERAISHYKHTIKWHIDRLSFDQAITNEKARLQGQYKRLMLHPHAYSFAHDHYSYLARGIYIKQLKRWMRYFPKEQFLILKSKDLLYKPQEVLTRVFAFLGLPNYILNDYPKVHVSKQQVYVSDSTREQLKRYFKSYNQQLYAYLGIQL